MRTALTICREYGQPPGWWDGLSREDRGLLLGEYRLRCEEAAKAAKRAKKPRLPRVR